MSSPPQSPPRTTSPPPPGGAKTLIRRRAAEQKNAAATTRPAGTRAAGVGGSSGTMLKLYTDDVGRGFKVDPVVVMVLSLGFIASVFLLHIFAKLTRKWSS